jgi:hypothetical protein
MAPLLRVAASWSCPERVSSLGRYAIGYSSLARDHDTKLRGDFPSELDLGSPIGEAGGLSVEVDAVMLGISVPP